MDEMTAFERQLAAELGQMAGAGRRIDGMAMVRAVATQSPQRRFGSMFSAARFLVAGTIVALFGGFLLSGLLTQPSDEQVPAAVSPTPVATPELLPGVDLVTEEVEPGVFRVVSDGTGNDILLNAAASPGDLHSAQVVAGQDGSVWVRVRQRDGEDRLFRLGVPGVVDASSLLDWWTDLSVAADGTMWALGEAALGWGTGTDQDQLVSLVDGRWVPQAVPDGVSVTGVETPPDGSVWASWTVETGEGWECDSDPGTSGRQLAVARLVDGQWVEEAVELDTLRVYGGGLAIGADGTTLLGATYGDPCQGPSWVGIMERTKDGWAPSIASGLEKHGIGPIAVGSDGTAWIYLNDGGRPGGPRLLHRKDGDWETLGADGSVPGLWFPEAYGSSIAVSPDGRLWVALPWQALSRERDTSVVAALDGPCAGVLAFDGNTWRQHLAGACASHVSAAPDGSVWVTVMDWDPELTTAVSEDDPDRALRIEEAAAAIPPSGIYVITPAAAAGGGVLEAVVEDETPPASLPPGESLVELEADASLRFIGTDGEPVSTISVMPGETLRIRVDNTTPFEHSFFIGTEEQLNEPGATTDVGIEPWTSGVRELVWTVPDDPGGLSFGCTVPGHFPSMNGEVVVGGASS